MKLDVKTLLVILFFVLTIPRIHGQYYVDWKQQVVQYVNIASTPSSPDQYIWQEETILGQGVHINIVPTKISKIYLESSNAKICFGSFINDSVCFTYFYRLDINIDNQGYNTIYNDDLVQTFVWDVSSIFTSVGTYDLKIRYYCVVPAVTYSREYKIFVVPPSDALFRDQYHNSIRLWKSPNTNATPLLLSPGFDAYNVKTEQYYRYAGSKLIECLNNNGFDIYILYYKYNPQDMRNNAAVYSSAVNYISTNFYNSGNIVAAGISMGGVITRYALSKAEDDETPLPVDRWISLDGPHQGAFIDSSLQEWLHVHKNNPFDNYANDNDAAKELLLWDRYDYSQYMRTTFYNELNSLNGDGYPHLTHNIGVSFSSSDPNPYSGVWLNITAQGWDSWDFTIGGYETLAGSFLPKIESDTVTSRVFYGLLLWTDVIVTNYKYPTFISHNSSLDIVNNQSKFETTIQPSFTSFHDVVPTDIIQPLVNELISDIYQQNKTITTSLQSNATQSIISGFSVTNIEPYGNFICDNGSDVTFQSEGNILLKPGFWAKNGSNFIAKIESIPTCSSYNNKSLLINNESNESHNSNNNDPQILNNRQYFQNYPNPFRDITKIIYKIDKQSAVNISIYDIYGMKIIDLLNNKIEDSGIHFIDFDFSFMPSGIYFCEFTNQSFHKVNKMIKIN